MGFFIRKSVRVGPLKFNLSKSGVGVSTGIKGFRVGFGPRGNYVHASAAGFQYRTTLTPNAVRKQVEPPKEMPSNSEPGVMQEIDSNMALMFQASSEDELVAEITQKMKRFWFWKWIACAAIGLGFYAHPGFFIAGLILAPLTFLWDETRKSVVLFYDFDENAQHKFENVVEGYAGPMSARRVWHLEASGAVKDWKKNSGATREFRRKKTAVSLKPPRFLKVNIPVPIVQVGTQSLCFLPHKLLILSSNSAATVNYSDLNIEIVLSRFIETEGVPSDAEVIDYTWQYVNKKGGPDKRFKNNKQYPICAYDAVGFSSPSGLNELIQISKRGQFDKFKNLVNELSRRAA